MPKQDRCPWDDDHWHGLVLLRYLKTLYAISILVLTPLTHSVHLEALRYA